MSIGGRIRKARKNLGISQESLAETLGVSTQAVSTWERDENVPETKKLLAISQVLKLSLDFLMAEDDDWKLKILYPESKLDQAIAYATAKHSGTFRKGTKIPYITHPMEAAAIVAAMTDDEEVIAAAVLHDVLEDTDASYQEVEKLFGHRVASLVADESENKREEEPAESTWKIRKQETLEHLKNASHEVKLIAFGDKLANIRAMRRDYMTIGDKLWERFNEKNKANHAWYYAGILQILDQDEKLSGTPLMYEYAACIDAVFHDVFEDHEDDEKLKLRCIYFDEAAEVYNTLREGQKIWSLILDRPDDPSMQQIQFIAQILDYFLRSDTIGFADTHLIILNDPESDEVYWQKTDDGYCIRLCVAGGNYWSQVAYQLSYAMMHCLIDHLGEDKPKIDWVEELICETMALSLLKRLGAYWDQTPFYKRDPDYAGAILEYIDDMLKDKGTSALIRCKDKEELQALNKKNSFDDRLDESHDLYNKIIPADFLRLARVRDYAADNLLLYTHYWRDHSEGSQALDYICRLQEQIPGCDLPAGISITIEVENSKPTDAQMEAYGSIIRGLKHNPSEYVHFKFLDEEKGEKEQIGLVYLRFYRMDSGNIAVYMRWDQKRGRKMYLINCDDDHAIGILNNIFMTNDVPDTTDWIDVTERFPIM